MTHTKKLCDYLQNHYASKSVPCHLPLPVRADDFGQYIWGPENEMVADCVRDYTQGEYKDDELGEPIRIRGWGRIQYIKDPEKTPTQIQDEIMEWVADAINAYAEPTLNDVLMALGEKRGKTSSAAMGVILREVIDLGASLNLQPRQYPEELSKQLCGLLDIT
jgi:hypothetical protein